MAPRTAHAYFGASTGLAGGGDFMGYGPSPAGWYPDNSRGGMAYWNGSAWTGQWQPPPQSTAGVPYAGTYRGGAPAVVPVMASAKSSGVAVFLSFLWPGLGHLYVGDAAVGLILGFSNLFLAFLTLLFILPGLLAFVLWIAGMVMAA